MTPRKIYVQLTQRILHGDGGQAEGGRTREV